MNTPRSLLPSFLLMAAIGLAACSNNTPAINSNPDNFAGYISGFTTGQISAAGEIAIIFVNEVDAARQKTSGLVTLNPRAEGEIRWVNSKTLVFQAKQPLKNGALYNVTLKLGELFDVEASKQLFTFSVRVIEQQMEIEFTGLEVVQDAPKMQFLTGVIYTADATSPKNAQKILRAELPGSNLTYTMDSEAGGRRHNFKIGGIERGEAPAMLNLSWNGAPIGAGNRGSQSFEILPETAFQLMDVFVIRGENPRVELIFSNLLDASQNLQGLIRIGDDEMVNYIIQGNKITVNPRVRMAGEQSLIISGAIKSSDGKRLDTEIRHDIQFYQPHPQIELIGNGSIIPHSKELLFPFKAVGLAAVDVHITRIFENNIGQFFQDGTLSSTNRWNLQRVGRTIFAASVPLAELGEVHSQNWNNYALDLSRLITPEPGAIYQVELGFRQHQAVYTCGENQTAAMQPDEDKEQSYWQNYQNYYYPDNYNWQERDNPCHESYYTSERRRARNVLASDIGLIAKSADGKSLTVFATNLLTAQALAGVKISAFDYQQQELVTSVTDANGKAMLTTPREAFYLTAGKGNQAGYLKINDGDALSLSDFDVSGAEIKQGVKGFLYGERGVWRPGDSLFVTLIVEDSRNTLPANHPVTFELRNPSGQVVVRQTHTLNAGGLVTFKHQTQKQAPTGNWLLEARVGGLSFSRTLKVETVKPNRLKIELDFAEAAVAPPSRTLQAQLWAQWLHGASARNLKTDVEMVMAASPPDFPDYPGYSFSDASIAFAPNPVMIFEGNLNETGKRAFSHQFNPMERGPARVSVQLRTRVYEPSGNFSIGRASTFYYPFQTIVGIKPPQSNGDYLDWLSHDETHTFEVLSLNYEGKPAPRKQLDVEVYNIRWRWWWERGQEDLSGYFERENVHRIHSTSVTTDTAGKGQFKFKLPEDADGGRYLVRVINKESGHSASAIVYFGWYGGRAESVSPARLTFTTDKEQYRVGEEIKLTIPSGEDARILVSLESSSHIVNTTWVYGQKGETSYTFRAEGEMPPNIYAHVMHIQPHGQRGNDLPLRMYGVIPIMIENPETRLAPQLKMPDEIRPETTVQIEVSELEGRAMNYTLALVDEGLLDLTNFATPDPHTHFYAREALGVKTWDLFDDVSTPYGEHLSRILSIGGSDEGAATEALNEASRFEPMVWFAGPFELKMGAANRHQIRIPNYVGSVRAMLVAAQNGAYGRAEKTVPVRKPVMVLATLPRVLGPGESVNMPVSVFAMNEHIKNVNLSLSASELFEVKSNTTSVIPFDEPGDKLETFSLQTTSVTGVAQVRVEATSTNEKAHDEIEIAVRNPNMPVTDVVAKTLAPGESWNTTFSALGMEGTNLGMLEVSQTPPADFGKRLNSLLRHPHNYAEAIISSAFAQLFVVNIADLSVEEKREIQGRVNETINQLNAYLTFNGGVAMWPGHEDANAWISSYAHHFLLEAEKRGFYVPAGMKQSLAHFQSERARNWNAPAENPRADLIQAYRLYTLALSNAPEIGAMNRLRESERLSPQARWRLAAAYAVAGQKQAADDLLTTQNYTVNEYQEMGYSFGSALRDKAMILETLILLERSDDVAPLAQELSRALSSDNWLNTQATAYSIIALAQYFGKYAASDNMQAAFSVNGKEAGINTNALLTQLPLSISEREENQFSLSNKGEGTLYARLILQGTPLIGESSSASSNLIQKVRFTNLQGDEIDPARLPQGTDFIAEVSISNPGLRGDYQELALSQIFPSGWEIRNTRMEDEAFGRPVSSFNHQDIRDDRVYTYFDLAANQTRVYRIQLNAAYAGRFYMPAISTSALFDDGIHARSAGKWVEVIAN